MSARPLRLQRALARALFAFIAALYAAGAALTFFAREAEAATSWGIEGIWAQVLFGLTMFSFPVAGLLITSNQADNRIGWLFQAIGMAWGLDILFSSYYAYAVQTPSGELPGAEIGIAVGGALWVPAVGLTGTYLLLLFPTGRLLSPGWKPLARVTAVVLIVSATVILFTPGSLADSGYPDITNPLGIRALESLLLPLSFVMALLPVCIVGSVISLVRRFRRSRGVERLQMKWLAAAAAAVAVTFPIAMFASVAYTFFESPDRTPFLVALLQSASLYALALIPAAAVVAILKHRLYDIDVVVNRALVYGALTSLLVLAYLLLVFVLQGLLRPVTSESDLVVAGSTLAVAALFRPLRSRIQKFIDQRFYRRKYDASRTLDDFASRLRDEIDLGSLGRELTGAVSATMQPSHVSLWLRDQEVSRR